MALLPIDIPNALQTPLERLQFEKGAVYVKRDDLFSYGDGLANGTKLREADAIASSGAFGLVGYGSRRSNTAVAMAAAGNRYDIPVIFHAPHGAPTAELEAAKALGATVVRHKPGYLSQCRHAARVDASRRLYALGLGAEAAIAAVAGQVRNLQVLPFDYRIVVPVGSGVLLTGVLLGLREFDLPNPVLGIVCGGTPDFDLISQYVPAWGRTCTFEAARERYEMEVEATLGEIPLDPIYEAKCLSFLRPKDVLWNSGTRTR